MDRAEQRLLSILSEEAIKHCNDRITDEVIREIERKLRDELLQFKSYVFWYIFEYKKLCSLELLHKLTDNILELIYDIMSEERFLGRLKYTIHQKTVGRVVGTHPEIVGELREIRDKGIERIAEIFSTLAGKFG